MSFKCVLNLRGLSIPIAAYVQAEDDDGASRSRNISLEAGAVKEPNTPRARHDYFASFQEAYVLRNTTTGYMYGSKFYPVSGAEEANLFANDNVEGCDIIAFVKKNAIAFEDIAGESSHKVVPDGPVGAEAFNAIARALHEERDVAIVRRIPKDKAEPTLNILIPFVNPQDKSWCFMLLELLYAEHRRYVKPVVLNSAIKSLSKEQGDAIEELIDSMMISDSKGKERFAPGGGPSSSLERLRNLVRNRASNPASSSSPMNQHFRNVFKSREAMEADSQRLLDHKLKELFPIKRK